MVLNYYAIMPCYNTPLEKFMKGTGVRENLQFSEELDSESLYTSDGVSLFTFIFSN